MRRALFITGWAFREGDLPRFEAVLRTLFDLMILSPSELLEGGGCPLGESIERSAQEVNAEVVFGWSLGAMGVLEAMSEFHLNVWRTVLIAATPRFVTDERWEWGIQPGQVRALRKTVSGEPNRAFGAFLELACAADRRAHYMSRFDCSRKGLNRGLDYLLNTDLRNRPAMDVPVLLIHSMSDRLIPWQASRALLETLPQGILSLWPSGEHDLLEAKEMRSTIAEFCR